MWDVLLDGCQVAVCCVDSICVGLDLGFLIRDGPHAGVGMLGQDIKGIIDGGKGCGQGR